MHLAAALSHASLQVIIAAFSSKLVAALMVVLNIVMNNATVRSSNLSKAVPGVTPSSAPMEHMASTELLKFLPLVTEATIAARSANSRALTAISEL